MANIILENLSLEYPIYDVQARSMRMAITRNLKVGGVIKQGKDNVSVVALDNLSMTINTGDKVAILGHNGAGKTTLLKVISGFYEPSSGAIHTEGKVTGLLNMTAGLDLNLNGLENIMLFGQLLGLSPTQIENKSEEIIEYSRLGAYLNMPMRTYSQGMTLRLAFAVCTSFQPEILLLDEWIGAGDQRFLDRAEKRIDQMISKSSILIFATHNIQVAKQLCNKAIYLEHGKLKGYGDFDSIFQQYEADVHKSLAAQA